jgi:flagellar protein FliO/FliZ
MELVSLMRTMGSLAMVLGLLGAALWIVRRYDIQLPGRAALTPGRSTRRVELVERIQLDQKRSVVLIRRDDREHLFVLHPDRATVLESRILRFEEQVAMKELVLCPSLDGEWYNG